MSLHPPICCAVAKEEDCVRLCSAMIMSQSCRRVMSALLGYAGPTHSLCWCERLPASRKHDVVPARARTIPSSLGLLPPSVYPPSIFGTDSTKIPGAKTKKDRKGKRKEKRGCVCACGHLCILGSLPPILKRRYHIESY